MMELVEIIMRPQFLVTLFAGIAAFATVLTIAVPIMSRDRLAQRMKVMAVERDKMRAQRITELAKDRQGAKLRQAPKGYMQEIVDQLDLRRRFDNEDVRQKLKMAGLRGQAPLISYMFFRVAMPILLFIAALIYMFFIAEVAYPPIVRIMIAVGVGFAGYYLPNVFIHNMVQKRQQAIKRAFPDSLDMLLICVQSGMSVEAAFGKVAKEVSATSLELAEELSLTTAELSYLQERRLAFENLGKRTGLPGVKAVATALIQAERYGTPVSQALRVMAKENREMRMSEAEKKAAALPPKLTVPMIIFFLPVLFLVILGPAAITFWEYK
ncbi:MAG: type II secretion system F family protein [Hyphomicrobiaceae bacterium]|nr:type II secretion system F family protein [Hyphomicrobiaceae bacterium]